MISNWAYVNFIISLSRTVRLHTQQQRLTIHGFIFFSFKFFFFFSFKLCRIYRNKSLLSSINEITIAHATKNVIIRKTFKQLLKHKTHMTTARKKYTIYLILWTTPFSLSLLPRVQVFIPHFVPLPCYARVYLRVQTRGKLEDGRSTREPIVRSMIVVERGEWK